MKYSDHYAVLLVFKDIPKIKEKKIAEKKHIVWNTNRKDSWDKYFRFSNENTLLDSAVNSNNEDANKLMNLIKREMTNLKYRCFGKVAVEKVSKEEKELQAIQKRWRRLI